MSPPHRQSAAQISAELGIHVVTLYNWRQPWQLQGEVVLEQWRHCCRPHPVAWKVASRASQATHRPHKGCLISEKSIGATGFEPAT